MKTVCRAFTFVNCQTPNMELDNKAEYITIGFFDGMNTERIEIDNKTQQLIPLWRHIVKCTGRLNGRYSYQNVFGFCYDEWNQIEDEIFWGEEMAEEYPLTFVVLMQTRCYTENMKEQCKRFGETAEQLRNTKKGVIYSYITVDKNDFIVCLKTKCYQCAVDTIKRLHEKAHILYSYSIFSIRNKEAARIKEYQDIYNEKIGSICLRGIGNSFTNEKMDIKYAWFCKQLTRFLYGSEELETKDDGRHVLYDILGENDFRYIAREVSLGKLIELFDERNLLSLSDKRFRTCLYSSNLVLNTRCNENPGNIWTEEELDSSVNQMNNEFVSWYCSNLEERMIQIKSQLEMEDGQEVDAERSRRILLAKGMWQILQSLSALEYPPTKKYDFISLYIPFKLLINLVEQRIEEEKLAESNGVRYQKRKIGIDIVLYELIRGFSSTLNGTLRTDIQFFQVRDYNAVVYYSPAKLRAFYGLWIYYVTKFYTMIEAQNEECAFVLVPGAYDGCSVDQVFKEEKDIQKLMIVKTSEKILYEPRTILFNLAHEGAHFVGDIVRMRKERYEDLYRIVLRLFEMEIYHFFSVKYKGAFVPEEIAGIFYRNDKNILSGRFEEKWGEIESKIVNEKEKYMIELDYYAENVVRIIPAIIAGAGKIVFQSAISDCQFNLNQLCNSKRTKNVRMKEAINFKNFKKISNELDKYCQEFENDVIGFLEKYKTAGLKPVLEEGMHLFKEIYADEIGILTLALSPADYIRAFIGNFNMSHQDRDAGIVLVRQSIVISGVSRALKQKKEKGAVEAYEKQSPDWLEENVWQCLKERLQNEEGAKELVMRIHSGYIMDLMDFILNIDKYKPMYNEECGNFINVENSVWNDEIIWKLLLNYAETCAVAFLEKCSENETNRIEQERLKNVYQELVKGDIVEMTAIIENFLSDCENDFYKNGEAISD